MEKGARVRIHTGSSEGKTGTIFWKGANKWGSGDRFGIRGDDGETYWASSDEVEAADGAPAPAPTGPSFSKGDRVAFAVRGQEGTGTVFWIGESRSGPGQRLGVRDDNGEEAVWIDARQARALEGQAPSASRPTRDYPDQSEEPPLVAYDMPPLDDGPPIDDAWVEQMAAHVDLDDDPPPPEW